MPGEGLTKGEGLSARAPTCSNGLLAGPLAAVRLGVFFVLVRAL